MSIIDALKPIHQAIYFVLWTLAHWQWGFNRLMLSLAIWMRGLHTFLLSNGAVILDLIAGNLVLPFGLLMTLALMVHGLFRILNAALGTQWQPIELSRTLAVFAFGAFFFASPAALMTGTENMRNLLASGVQTAVTASYSSVIIPPSFQGGDPGLTQVSAGLDGDPSGVSAIDLAASYLYVTNQQELDQLALPTLFQQTYFPYGPPANFTLGDEQLRNEAIATASQSIDRLSAGPVLAAYAFVEATLWLLLDLVALALWIGLPFALMVSGFGSAQALVSMFFNRYIGLFIETAISVTFSGIMAGVLLQVAPVSFVLLQATSLIALMLLFWRMRSAASLLKTSLDMIGGAAVTGGATVGTGMRAAGSVGRVVAGTALTAATVGTGAALLGLSAMKSRGDGEDEQSSTAALAGGYLVGRSPIAGRAMQTYQMAKVMSGNHDTKEDGTGDAAYLGSLLGGSGAISHYLTLSAMGGMGNTMSNLGVGTFGEDAPLVSEDGVDVTNFGYHGDTRPTRLASQSPTSSSENNRATTALDIQAPMPPNFPEADGLSKAPTNQPPPPPQFPEDEGLYKTPPQQRGSNSVSLPLPKRKVVFKGGGEVGVNRWVKQLGDTENALDRREQILQSKARVGPVAEEVGDLIEQYSAESVQEVVNALSQLVAQKQETGASAEDILSQFQSGEAYEELNNSLTDSPLKDNTDAQSAIATLTLLPRIQVGRTAVIQALAGGLQDGRATANSLIQDTFNTPVGLASYSGVGENILAQARVLNLSPEQLTQAAKAVSRRDGIEAMRALRQGGGGVSNEAAGKLISDMTAIPEKLTLPQTADVRNSQLAMDNSQLPMTETPSASNPHLAADPIGDVPHNQTSAPPTTNDQPPTTNPQEDTPLE